MTRFFILVFTLLFLISLVACGSKTGVQSTDNSGTTASTNTSEEEESAITGPVYQENGVVVSTSAFPEDTQIKVVPIAENDTVATTIENTLIQAESFVAYDISATNGGVTVQPDSSVSVAFPIPQAFNKNTHTLEVYYISDTGIPEKLDCTISSNAVTVNLSHFSLYVVTVVKKGDFAVTNTPDNNIPENTTSGSTEGIQETTVPTPAAPAVQAKAPSGAYFGRMVHGDLCYKVTLTFEDNTLRCGYSVGDSFDSFYAAGEFDEPKDVIFQYEAEFIEEYNGTYYRFSRGGGTDPYPLTSSTGSETVLANGFGFAYTYINDTTLKITSVTGEDEELSQLIASGVVFEESKSSFG